MTKSPNALSWSQSHKLAPSLYGWTGLLARAHAAARVGCQLALGAGKPTTKATKLLEALVLNFTVIAQPRKPHSRPCQHKQRPATLYGPSENTSAHHNTKDIKKNELKHYHDRTTEPNAVLVSEGAMTLIFMVEGARAVSSVVMHSWRSTFARKCSVI